MNLKGIKSTILLKQIFKFIIKYMIFKYQISKYQVIKRILYQLANSEYRCELKKIKSASRCISHKAEQVEPLSADFWGHCVLSGGTQPRALPRHQREETKIHIIFKLIFHFLEWGSNLHPVWLTVTLCAPAPRPASLQVYFI